MMSSGRSARKKKAPVRLQSEDLDTPSRARSSKRPRHSLGIDENRSRTGSPDSRSVTPLPGRGGRGGRNSAVGGRGAKRGSGDSTPVNRNSRASSVSSTAKGRGKKSGSTSSAKKPKIRTKLGRGYNPDLVNYKESEYHYGSDFEDQDDDIEGGEGGSDSVDSDSDDSDDLESRLSDDLKPESDVELEPMLEDDEDDQDHLPFWLQADEDEELERLAPTDVVADDIEDQRKPQIPPLILPDSSDDLVIKAEVGLCALAVYEILRQYHLILRLSPFRFEDFCGALNSEEQSNLLSEIHICLLKALLREDELQMIQFGPLDQKDSTNVFLYIIDHVTWPENLRVYLTTEPSLASEAVLNVVNHGEEEYPFTSVENRLTVLQFLANQFLTTSAVRDWIHTECQLQLEDHCRVCHRLGDMIVCELCNGPFHGTCLDPPLYEVPEDEWVCPVCNQHKVEGVYDCVMTDPASCRLDSLGIDRKGNRYWLGSRRIWVEERTSDASGSSSAEPPICQPTRYYSTRAQLNELLEALDPELYEKDLCENIETQREDIESFMEATENLTNMNRMGNTRTWIDMDNSSAEKLRTEREALRERYLESQKAIQDEVDKQIKEQEEDQQRARQQEGDNQEEKSSEKTEESEKMDTDEGAEKPETKNQVRMEDLIAQANEEAKADNEAKKTKDVMKKLKFDPTVLPELHALKRPAIPAGNYFRLGEELGYKNYKNLYSTLSYALSKTQSKEEMEKKIRLSHKFSLTDVSTFKWPGAQQGLRQNLVNTVRQAITNLENNLPSAFMHTNWPLLRKPWLSAVGACANPSKDFSRALTVLVCCIKPCLLVPAWTESLGHTSVKKIGFQSKEAKLKQEKKEKKEREDEDEKMKPFLTWVKYTLPVKSLSVVRQKGEEYRAHGRNGWLWLSNTRNFNPQDGTELGLRAGPHRVAVKYTELMTNTSKVVLMEPKALTYLMSVQKERDDKALARMVVGDDPDMEDDVDENNKPEGEDDKRKASLNKILEMSRVDTQDPSEEDLGGPEGVVDISQGMVDPTRLLYPKSAKKSRLDDLLTRRIQLKVLEEKRIEVTKASDPNGTSDSANPASDGDKDGTKETKTTLVATNEVIQSASSSINLQDNINGDQAVKSEKEEQETKAGHDLIWLREALSVVRSTIRYLLGVNSNLPDGLSYFENEDAGQKAPEAPSCNGDAVSSLSDDVTYRQLTCYSPLCQSGDANAACYSASCRLLESADRLEAAAKVYKLLSKKANEREMGMTTVQLTDSFMFTSCRLAVDTLQTLHESLSEQEQVLATSPANNLMTIASNTVSKDSNDKSQATASSPAQSLIKQEKDQVELDRIKKEKEEDEKYGIKRLYTLSDTSGVLYLKRIQTVAEAKRSSRIVKYPLAPTFWSRSRNRRNILIPGRHDLKRLARNGGQNNSEGFNYGSKNNLSVWPYPCPRPTFKTAWLYRTACMHSLHSVAMQLRILWMCIRWDDLATRPPTQDGKNQITTDSEIITTEILKHRNIGRFLQQTQYYQKKVTIPLDQPRKQVDYSPIRTGLRKRKRDRSPVQAEPQVEENWVEEDQLELWEIKAYKEKAEGNRMSALTRRQAGANIKPPEKYDPSEEFNKKKLEKMNTADLKAKLDADLKEQQEALRDRQGSNTPDLPNSKLCLTSEKSGIKIVPSNVAGPTVISYTGQTPPPGTKKIFLSRDGKIIGHQISSIPGSANKASTAVTPSSGTKTSATGSPATPSQQKVQIVKTADGKIQVRGLLPGQQLVQMPDGKLQIFTNSSTQSSTSTTQTTTVVQQPTNTTTTSTTASNAINSTTPSVPDSSGPQLAPKPVTTGPLIIKAGGTKPVTAAFNLSSQQANSNITSSGISLQPKPTVFGIGSSSSVSLQPPGGSNVVGTPAKTVQLQPPGINNSATPSPMKLSTVDGGAAPSTAKLVGIQSLGQNTVTMQNGQLVVQGPDTEAATNIARQLASGQAKIANLAGKQVLLITNPTPQQQVATVSQPATFSQNQLVSVPSTAPSEVNHAAGYQATIGSSPSTFTSPAVQQPSLPPAHTPIYNKPLDTALQNPVPQSQEPVTGSLTVAAQLVQTQQGPRIILQGLQGVKLSPDQLQVIQQKVKAELLKQQAAAKEQGKVPPTKIVLELATTTVPQTTQPQPPTGKLSTSSKLNTPEHNQTSTLSLPEHQQQQALQQHHSVNNIGISQQQIYSQQHQQSLLDSQQQNLISDGNQYISENSQLQQPHGDNFNNLGGLLSPSVSGAPTGLLSPSSVYNNTSTTPIKQQPQQVSSGGSPKIQTLSLPEYVIRQGKFVEKEGKRVLLLPPHILEEYRKSVANKQLQQGESPPGGPRVGAATMGIQHANPLSPSGLMNTGPGSGLFSPTGLGSTGGVAGANDLAGDKFELTEDYIQQTIQEALKSGNLTQEQEEKLINQLAESSPSQLDAQTNIPTTGLATTSPHRTYSNNRKNRNAPAAGSRAARRSGTATGNSIFDTPGNNSADPMNVEWTPPGITTGGQQRSARGNKRGQSQQQGAASFNDIVKGLDFEPPQLIVNRPPVGSQSSSIVTSAAANSSLPVLASSPPAGPGGVRLLSPSSASHPTIRKVMPEQQQPQHQPAPVRMVPSYSHNKLSSLLFKHKERLEKEIAKKRSLLEKDLSMDISKDIESLKQKAALKLGAETAALISQRRNRKSQDSGSSNAASPAVVQRLPQAAAAAQQQLDYSATTVPAQLLPTANKEERKHNDFETPPGKKRRKSRGDEPGKGGSGAGGPGAKKEKLYCICKSKFDSSKFYVGCDICSNWFHGSCVGITQKMSKKMSEYVCEECTQAKQGDEIYCLCKQPYDDSQFYIGCERCPDWFHGRCVGIFQAEASTIDEYVCPKCEPNSAVNLANFKTLTSQDYDTLKRLFRQIQSNKSSQPFRKPLNRAENPRFYDVIKEPMDLQTIEQRLECKKYKKLAEFIGDMIKITDNCRYFNPPGAVVSKTADSMEHFVASKIPQAREKISGKRSKK